MQTMTCARCGFVATAATMDEALQMLFEHGSMHPTTSDEAKSEPTMMPGADAGMMQSES